MGRSPNGAGPDSVAFVIALDPPVMVVIGLPLTSSTTNEESGGTTIDPPVLSVSGCTSEIRFRFLWLDESVYEISAHGDACDVDDSGLKTVLDANLRIEYRNSSRGFTVLPR